MKTVEQLEAGETLIAAIYKTKNADKFQVELAEVIVNPEAPINIAALANADDEAFAQSQPKARRAWQSFTSAMLKQYFGIDVASLTFETVGKKEVAQVSVENPSIAGHRLVVQLMDSLTPNFSNSPKQYTHKTNGVRILTVGGQPIYQTTKMVAEKDCKHTIIKKDGEMSEEAFLEYASTVGAESENLSA